MTRLVPAPPGLFTDPSPRGLPSSSAHATGVKPAHSRRAKATAKGHAVELLARKIFEASGCLVESAPKMIHWQQPRGADGKTVDGPRVPRTSRHDFFGVWDLIVVDPVGSETPRRVRCVQVTDSHNASARSRKILSSDWPVSRDDWLLAYVGRGAFKVYIGPDFDMTSSGLFQMPRKARR